jgi:hypothetical protein
MSVQTPEMVKRIGKVAELASKGLTSGQIAKQLNITRSSVMGIVFRHGILLSDNRGAPSIPRLESRLERAKQRLEIAKDSVKSAEMALRRAREK